MKAAGARAGRGGRRGRFRRSWFFLALLLLLGGGLALERVLSFLLPFPVDALGRFGASRVVLDRHGEILRVAPTALGERLLPIRLEEVSPHLVHALLAGEDRRFFSHGGVDWQALVRAGFLDLARGRIVSGASTITMQVARLAEPGGRPLVRKLREIFRARELERIYPKKRILEFYLNMVPLGGTLRGFQAASLYWFGKPAACLGPAEAAALVAMLPAPTRRRPDRRPDLLRFHRNQVLDRMLERGYLDREEWKRARAAPLRARVHPWPFRAPHACDLALARSEARVVKTGIDLGIQAKVERVVRAFRGPPVDGLALVVLDRENGEIRALLGSRDYRKVPLDACLCPRPAGSTLKPFLYALAFQEGVTAPDGLLLDAPMRIKNYNPENFTRDFAGLVRAREALAASRNLPAIRLLREVGVEAFRDFLGRLGIGLRERALYLDLALGTESVSPLDLARAWWRFSSPEADLPVPWKTRKKVLEILSARSPDPEVLPPGRAAWKTGTSSNRRDAWTVGSEGRFVVCAWLGNLDDRSDPGLVGADSAALLFARVLSVLDPSSSPVAGTAGKGPGR